PRPLGLGKLPGGGVSISGTAYALPCTDATIGMTAVPAWIAEPVSAVLVTGASVTVPITSHVNTAGTVSANFIKNVTSLSTGSHSTYAVMADGTVKTWGITGAGLGTVLAPTDLPGASSWAEVSVPGSFACLRTPAGAVSCWGLPPGAASSLQTPTP